MLRYGKKHDCCYGDKLARSNRGRARTAATSKGRKHVNLGYRRSQVQLVAIRADKKRARLQAQLSIEDALFDLELAKFDPEIWLHGIDLTTFEDTGAKLQRGSHFNFAADPYEYVPDAFDWDWSCQNDNDAFHYLHSYDYAADWDADRSDPNPEPSEAAWRDLWVEGRAHDHEDRDYDRWYDSDYDDYDTYDFENPLLEREDPVLPATIEVVEERAIERHRAGERYFKQTGRTVLKPLGTEMRPVRHVVAKPHRRVA